MTGPLIGLAVSVFLACTVEAVEAVTIVLAVGTTRSWRSAMTGVGAALLTLAVMTAILGPALTAIPLRVLQYVVGTLLLIFGLQWLRKAILRFSGLKELHDESAAFRQESEAARTAGPVRTDGAIDPYAFLVSFKGSFLEGLEVVFIVVTFGAQQKQHGGVVVAAVAAMAAVSMVICLGAVVRAPLARVPENQLKFVVGIMLTSFGCFWAGEGAGAHWPGNDISIIGLIVLFALMAAAVIRFLRRTGATGSQVVA